MDLLIIDEYLCNKLRSEGQICFIFEAIEKRDETITAVFSVRTKRTVCKAWRIDVDILLKTSQPILSIKVTVDCCDFQHEAILRQKDSTVLSSAQYDFETGAQYVTHQCYYMRIFTGHVAVYKGMKTASPTEGD